MVRIINNSIPYNTSFKGVKTDSPRQKDSNCCIPNNTISFGEGFWLRLMRMVSPELGEKEKAIKEGAKQEGGEAVSFLQDILLNPFKKDKIEQGIPAAPVIVDNIKTDTAINKSTSTPVIKDTTADQLASTKKSETFTENNLHTEIKPTAKGNSSESKVKKPVDNAAKTPTDITKGKVIPIQTSSGKTLIAKQTAKNTPVEETKVLPHQQTSQPILTDKPVKIENPNVLPSVVLSKDKKTIEGPIVKSNVTVPVQVASNAKSNNAVPILANNSPQVLAQNGGSLVAPVLPNPNLTTNGSVPLENKVNISSVPIIAATQNSNPVVNSTTQPLNVIV